MQLRPLKANRAFLPARSNSQTRFERAAGRRVRDPLSRARLDAPRITAAGTALSRSACEKERQMRNNRIGLITRSFRTIDEYRTFFRIRRINFSLNRILRSRIFRIQRRKINERARADGRAKVNTPRRSNYIIINRSECDALSN